MYRRLTLLVFVVAIALRLLLCWGNPPDNSIDDHYGPIALIMQTGEIPAKDACFQCYHPPVFYYSSAIVGKSLIYLFGATDNEVEKCLQFLNCLYVILTLFVIYMILKRLHLSEFPRLLALSIICFLPRHIFMSALHSNDSLAYLGISLCVYFLFVLIDRELSWPFACLLGITVTLTIFVKYTAFIVLPMVAIPLGTLIFIKSAIPRSKAVTALLLVLLVPLILLGIYMSGNYRDYGRALPWNDTMFSTVASHPRDPDRVSFTSFTPWQYIKEPIVVPGQMHSFWTLVYSGMWVDSEPKFTHLTDKNPDWWGQYFNWLRGSGAFPSSAAPISTFTRTLTAGLLMCGIVPLALILIGFGRCIRIALSKPTYETVKFQAFPLMLCFNAIGILLLVLKAPLYSSMKASYFLNSLPAFGVFTALSLQSIENMPLTGKMIALVFCAIILLASLYVIRIILAL